MLTIHFSMRKFIHLALFIGVLGPLLTACSLNGSGSEGEVATPMSSTVTSAQSVIRHSPNGVVQLTWDHDSHVLMVQLALTGLNPKSVHPAFINSGSCKNPGKAVYSLTDVKADTIGFANAITRIKDVADGIPENGWYVDVHNSAGKEAAQTMPITCANIFNAASAKQARQTITATLDQAFAPNQSASGTAQLVADNNQVTVTLAMKGLVPNSKHLADIHSGSCASQGKLLYPLKPVIVNTAGEGSSTTIIDNLTAIPRNGWYVNIHLGGTDDAEKAISDFIACGDITARV